MGKPCQNLRKKWTQENLVNAVSAVGNGVSQREASRQFKVPRRTLKRYLEEGVSVKRLGRPSLLTIQQENDFVRRIKRYAQVGLPLTPKLVRHQMFKYCQINKIPNNFNQEKQVAGKDWLRLFLRRNPDLSTRRAQNLNPARAQKLNRAIVSDYFEKINELMTTLNLKDKPQNVYNMDEKGCRLTIHHQQRVLAERGVKRVHMVAPEHAENVTVVACCNAIGNAIPPMIIFKGKRLKPEFLDNLPHGSLVKMAPKGSMTTELFIDFLNHFAKYKSNGPTLLVFDGASSHLDFTIAAAADDLNINLFCLPSNTTHELQPLDKAVFRSFEAHWDQELLKYWDTYPQRTLNKARFNIILSRVWPKCITPENIINGFRATGLFPLNPDAIHHSAFAPSLVTQREMPNNIQEENHEQSDADSVAEEDVDDSSDEENIPLSILARRVNLIPEHSSPEKKQDAVNKSFDELLPTPINKKDEVKTRKKAINYKAQQVTRDLFNSAIQTSASCSTPSVPSPSTSKQLKKSTFEDSVNQPGTSRCTSKQFDNDNVNQSWFCVACRTSDQLDMRMCVKCLTWYHEECVGLNSNDLDNFECC